ncbi:MAG: TIGR00366 family protein [Gammaproteobacteria bacterium]
MLNALRALGAKLSIFTERWVPDSWVICMGLTALALVLATTGAGAAPDAAVLAWGKGVWSLLTLAMQFTIAMVAAHACVTAAPMYRFMDRLASLPDPARPVQAVALAGAFSLATAYINWAFCLVACALFTPFVLRRNPNVDVRVLVAAGYLGCGTVWHGGLSGSAPLILATPGNPLLAPAVGTPIVERLYPITETLFNRFNLVYLAVIAAVSLAAVCLLHPARGAVRVPPERIDALLPAMPATDPAPRTPAEHIDALRAWIWLAAFLLAWPLGHSLLTRGFGATWTIDAYNAVFLICALLLHGRAGPFLRAVRAGVDGSWGIIVQFPFYGGIFGLLQHTDLGHWLGMLFASIATTDTFALVVYLYSAFMNLFVPSGGSKWLMEAPFLIPAGGELGVSPTTVMLAYAYGDSTTNLIQPFFAIPILTMMRLRFGDVVGYTFLVACACFAVSAAAMLLIPPNL